MPTSSINKRLVCCLLFLTASVGAGQQDLIEQLHQAYVDVNYFAADFVQEKQVKFLSKPLISKGKIKFHKNSGMVWEIIEPIWVKTKINDSGIFKTNQFYQDKKVTDVQMKAVAGILTELLSSQLNRIESQFTVAEVMIDDGQKNWKATLLADSLLVKKALNSLLIEGYLPSADQQKGISQITIIDQANNQTQITFSNVELHKEKLSQDLLDDFQ